MTSSVNGTNSASGSSTGGDSVGVNLTDVSQLQNNFITLMVAQIQYQDPTDPVDNKEMLAQMAQFSSLAGLSDINDTLKLILTKLDSVLQNQTGQATATDSASTGTTDTTNPTA